MTDVAARGWERYLYLLQKYPLRTKPWIIFTVLYARGFSFSSLLQAVASISDLFVCVCITSGLLAGSSDCLAQKIAGAKSLNYKRAFFMLLYGFVYGGPFGHYFHKLMDRIFAGSKKDGTTVVKKVVLEQVTANPFNNLLYMCYIGIMLEGRTWTSLKSKVVSDYPGVQLNSWRFWPLVSLINYSYVPLNLRPLFANLAAVCWANYLKWRVLSSGMVPVVNSGALKKAL